MVDKTLKSGDKLTTVIVIINQAADSNAVNSSSCTAISLLARRLMSTPVFSEADRPHVTLCG